MVIFDTLNLDLSYWAPLLAIVAAGGIMRGFAGFGATMVMVPFLSLLMSPKEAVLLALSTDVLVMTPMFPKAAKKAEWKPVIPVVIGAFLGMPLGIWILVIANPETMRIIISILVIGCACLLLSGWTYKGQKTSLLSFCVGMFSGASNGASSIGGPPIAVYFISKGMPPITLRASLNVVAFIMEGVAAIAIYFAGNFNIKNVASIIILFPCMLLFAWIGSVIFRFADNNLFNKSILYFLIIFGGYILISSYPNIVIGLPVPGLQMSHGNHT